MFLTLTIRAGLIALAAAFSMSCGHSPPPAPAGQTEPGGGSSALTTEQLEGVESVIRLGLPSIEVCYEDEMSRRGGEKSTLNLILRFFVNEQGQAEQVNVGPSDLSAEIKQCVESLVHGWSFPPLNKATSFTYPLELSPAY